MRIYVCVKQVPDTSGTVAVNPDGTLNRASMQTIINPDDLAAMEQALLLKDATGCQVTAVTMGPPPAEGMLRELLAMGADDAILISAREFGGSDTFATSQIISAAITHTGLGEDDMIFSGRQAIDGDTAQVGPQIAEKLNLPQISYAAEIKKEGSKDFEALKDEPLIELDKIGLKGSPTNIFTSFTPPQKGVGEMLEGANKDTAATLAAKLLEKHVI